MRGNAEHETTLADHAIPPIDLLVVNLYPFEATVRGRRRFRHLHREYRHRRPGDDPRRGEEPRRRHRGGRSGRLYGRARRDRAPTAARHSPLRKTPRGQGLRPHRRLRRGDRHLVRRQLDERHARRRGLSPARSSARCATARTRINGRPSTRRRSSAPASPPPTRCRARSSPTTISTTPTRPTSSSPSSIRSGRQPSPSSSTPIRAASPSRRALPTPTTRRWPATPVSAFGGIVALNRDSTRTAAREIVKIFTEVIIAPDASAEAKEISPRRRICACCSPAGLPNPRAPGSPSARSPAASWCRPATTAWSRRRPAKW